MDLDCIIRNGTVVTAADVTPCDVGIKNGLVSVLATSLPPAPQEIDATGKLVLPGGVDAHCHLDQPMSGNVIMADDFYTGSVEYIPYEGMHLLGWPNITLSRGEVVWNQGEVLASNGRGQFLPCNLSTFARPKA